MVDFSSVVLLDTETPDTSREIYSEDADDATGTCNSPPPPPPRYKPGALAIELNSFKAIVGKELSLSSW